MHPDRPCLSYARSMEGLALLSTLGEVHAPVPCAGGTVDVHTGTYIRVDMEG